MKKKQYQVSIDKPCGEDWSQMLPTDNGRYCIHCAKTVIDFSTMTDSQISAFITQQKANGKQSFCGRFRNEQLNRPLAPEYSSPSPSFALPILVAGALALAGSEVQSGTDNSCINKADTTKVVRAENSLTTQDTSKATSTVSSDAIKSNRFTLEGCVCDTNGKPVVGAQVKVIGTTRGGVTKPDGRFTIVNIPEGSYAISIKSVSHRERVVHYNTSKPQLLEIVLEPKEFTPMGQIVVGRIQVDKSKDVGVTRVIIPRP